MTPAPFPENEEARLRALARCELLDTAFESQFDAITAVAREICGVPIAAISLIDGKRQWFKSLVGLPPGLRETPRDISFCGHAIIGTEMLEVHDACTDERFRDNPLVTGAPHIRRYAGVPLIDPDGFALGTLCVIGDRPGILSLGQRDALCHLAHVAASLIENRRRELEAARLRAALDYEVDSARQVLMKAAQPRLGKADGVHSLVEAAECFSGDLIGAERSPDGSLTLMLADVIGHGLASSLFLLPLLEAFTLLAARGAPVSAIAVDLNHRLRLILPPGHFVGACLARLDRESQTVEIWNGGLPPATWLDRNGRVVYRWPSRHVALGILGASQFDATAETYRWSSDGTLMIHSDGLIEARNAEGQPFGEDRLHRVLSQSGSGADRIDAVIRALRGFVPGQRFGDDVSVILVDSSPPALALAA